ncbi:MAG: M56 family metallopeptidase [Clostridia bacterium]|nr:M56 family metallopeptidase [Clostridia bacterium]
MLNFLITLGGISLAMSVVIILMLALRKPIKKRFAALGRYIIWSVIIIRLCLPVSLDILPKLITLPSVMPEEEAVIYEPVTPEVIPEVVTPSEPSSEVVNEPVFNNTEKEIHTPVTPTPVTEKLAFEITTEHIIIALFTVWAVGAVTFVTVTLVRYRINAKRLDKALSIPAPELWSIYDTVCRELGIKKAPPLYMGRADVSPMVYGFFNPKVILPSVDMSAQTVTYILRHELTHYKRGDLWFKLLAMLANALHWFNPLAYAACGMMSAEAELSCDESALRKTDLMGRLGYGNSMLEIVKLCRHAPKLTTGFSPKKRAVKERFENMINTTKKKKGYWIVALIVAAALICTSLIGCASSSSDFDITPLDTENKTWEEIKQTRYDTGNFTVSCFDKEENGNWKFERQKNKLVLTNKDGRSYKYSKAMANRLGTEYVYNHEAPTYIPHAYIADDTGIMIFSASEPESCGRVCMIFMDLNSGKVINSCTYTGEDILSLHSMTEDDLCQYNKWYGEDWTYHVTATVSKGRDAEDYDEKGRIAIELRIVARDGMVSCSSYYDTNSNSFGDIVKEYCEIEKGRYTSDIERLSNLENVPEGAYECINAFLQKDTKTLEAMAGYPEGLLEDYKDFEFGDYIISLSDSGLASLLIEIEESPVYWIETGKHSFTYINNNGIRYMINSGTSAPEEPVEYEWPVNRTISIVDRWITYANEPLIPYGEQYNEKYYAGVMYILNSEYDASTLDDYRREAKRAFGIDILTDVYVDDSAILDELTELNLYTDRHSYEPYFPHWAIDSSDNYVVLQFYADYGGTVPAYKVRYNFALDGEDVVFRGSEKFDDTGRDIRQLYDMEYEVISD